MHKEVQGGVFLCRPSRNRFEPQIKAWLFIRIGYRGSAIALCSERCCNRLRGKLDKVYYEIFLAIIDFI